MSVILSILDQSPVYPGETTTGTFANTLALAKKSEELGFHRFWVSEHHDSEHVAGSSPEVLISYLLAKTERIRVGSGGIMLQHYSPYKVAENFHVLASLAPGRVDLGVGRAPGGLPRSTQALQRGIVNPQSLTEKIVELRHHIEGGLPEGDPLEGLKASPIPTIAPELHVLGASNDSAELAASLGLPYVFSLFIGGDEEAAIAAIRKYRDSFNAEKGTQPQAILALSAIVADTDEEARSLVPPQKLVKVHLASGRKVTLGNIEQAEEYGRQSGEAYTIEEKEPLITVGSKATVRGKLLELQEATGVDEFIITTNIAPFDKRVRSYELLSEAFAEVTA
ncbi:luciferase family oxidoreductase group 1 [Paenibacillus phyllosphaerae]|uniref:Luciferase family oxidoreductase group 1 n=1 Tax=Paenibacillus phyllosphaerae TaxID=274593 RepID=A0A7W5FPR0_9BACL|nr:LLM class flavin-dependent oxidoreductase [Paenibacillus phyllosphaerae]MBB3112483.1 luciferase family oxidoreductase group 1 [Paenibacillus phyllosphaerae]